MSEPQSSSTFAGLNLSDDEDKDVVNEPVVEETPVVEEDKVDLGNHEADDVVEPPHVNDKGELVDSEGKKVFTTTEEALKDGSMVLDHKGRMPGIYLDDLEEEQNELRRKRYEAAFEKSDTGKNSVVERQVNVVNSPLPPVTVPVKQENPLPDTETHESDVVEESDTAKVG